MPVPCREKSVRGYSTSTMLVSSARALGFIAATLSLSTLLVSFCRVQFSVVSSDTPPGGHLRRVASVGCSVRVNTFRRNDLLDRFVKHYERCGAAREIVVVWSDAELAPPEWLVLWGVAWEHCPLPGEHHSAVFSPPPTGRTAERTRRSRWQRAAQHEVKTMLYNEWADIGMLPITYHRSQ